MQLLLTLAFPIAQIESVMNKVTVLFSINGLMDGGATLPEDAFLVRFRVENEERLIPLAASTHSKEQVSRNLSAAGVDSTILLPHMRTGPVRALPSS